MLSLFVLILSININWILVKIVLKVNGYPVRIVMWNLEDFRNLGKLIIESQDDGALWYYACFHNQVFVVAATVITLTYESFV